MLKTFKLPSYVLIYTNPHVGTLECENYPYTDIIQRNQPVAVQNYNLSACLHSSVSCNLKIVKTNLHGHELAYFSIKNYRKLSTPVEFEKTRPVQPVLSVYMGLRLCTVL